MSLFFHRPLRVLATGALCGLVAISLTACSGKPENSPVIRKKLAEVDEIKDQLDQTTRLLTSLNGELTIMRDEISNLRAFTPDGEGATAIMNRMETLEKRLTELDATAIASVARTANAPAASTQNTTTSSAPSREAGSTSTTTTAATTSRPADSFPRLATVGSSSGSSASSAPATTSTTAAPARQTERTAAQATTSTASNRNSAPPAPAPRGRYYTIQSGDTLDKIAGDNNVSVTQLREANRLPAGARPLPGQRLFVPAGI